MVGAGGQRTWVKGSVALALVSESASSLLESPEWPGTYWKLRAMPEERESERSQVSKGWDACALCKLCIKWLKAQEGNYHQKSFIRKFSFLEKTLWHADAFFWAKTAGNFQAAACQLLTKVGNSFEKERFLLKVEKYLLGNFENSSTMVHKIDNVL